MPIHPSSDTPTGPPASVLITAGPTHEPIDSVRYIANRSSGRLGVALADAARTRGCRTTVLMGPCEAVFTKLINAQTEPANAENAAHSPVRVLRFHSSHDLQALLLREAPTHDVLIMAAAVADYRPAHPHRGKLSRTDADLTLTLEPVPDLLAMATARLGPCAIAIGFALDHNPRDYPRARAKMARKGCQAIVLNPLATMDSGGIDATILFAPELAGRSTPLTPGPLTKPEFAIRLIDVALGLWASARGNAS